MDRNKKQTTNVRGYYSGMSDIESRQYHGKPIRQRAVVTITTTDEQVIFFEVRDILINIIKNLQLEVGEYVSIDFIFSGTMFKDKWFNNLFINKIQRYDYSNIR